jgi:hypothetical protein
MDPVVRLDALLFAGMCLCGAVMVWAGTPNLSDSSFRWGRTVRVARISLSLLATAVLLILWVFNPSVVRIGPLDSEHERLLIFLTPLWCLLALATLILMILALRHKFFPSRRRSDEYDPW